MNKNNLRSELIKKARENGEPFPSYTRHIAEFQPHLTRAQMDWAKKAARS